MSRETPARAVRLFREFHKFEPTAIGDFNRGFSIPSECHYGGDAVHVLYRSDKLHPITKIDEGEIDYIHEHGAGVKVYRCGARLSGAKKAVPAFIRNVKTLVHLGESLGFQYVDDDGYTVDAEATAPRPDLYSIPSGKALLVIQGRRRVLALIWGGRLDVEPRGIVH